MSYYKIAIRKLIIIFSFLDTFTFYEISVGILRMLWYFETHQCGDVLLYFLVFSSFEG